MTRRRYIQIEGELVEVTPDYQQEPRNAAAQAGILWNDRAYQDMGDPRFKSRTQHREYMKAKGLTTTDDYKGVWRDAEKRRVAVRKGAIGITKRDIGEAIQKLNAGYKPRIQKEQ